jgi:hypothetical protein
MYGDLTTDGMLCTEREKGDDYLDNLISRTGSALDGRASSLALLHE